MDFEHLLRHAQGGDEHAIAEILQMYRPLLIKNSVIQGRLDEDLYQELCLIVLKCIKLFRW